MFEWDGSYDNEWYYFYKPELNPLDFYLCNNAIGLNIKMDWDTVDAGELLEGVKLAAAKQKEIFAVRNRSSIGVGVRPFRFTWNSDDETSEHIMTIVDSPYLKYGLPVEVRLVDSDTQQEIAQEFEAKALQKASVKVQLERDEYEYELREEIKQNRALLREIKEQQRKLQEMVDVQRKLKTELEGQKAEIAKLRQITNYGFVYLLHDATNGLYKIGLSKDPAKRLSQIRTGSANDITMVYTIETGDMVKLEQELHAHFRSKHVRGEWFALDGIDVEYIKSF